MDDLRMEVFVEPGAPRKSPHEESLKLVVRGLVVDQPEPAEDPEGVGVHNEDR
jgi:hypothetical protein